MLSYGRGYDTQYLTDGVAGGREGYYSAAVTNGEPPGVWYGAGAATLGLVGEVNADLLEAIYANLLDPRDPAAHDRSMWRQAAMLSAGHKQYKTPGQLYEAAVAKEPHAGPERRAELRAGAERDARQALPFIDLTFNATKSFSVAAVAFERAANEARAVGDEAGAEFWAGKHRVMEEAVLAGARAGIDFLQERAGYGRVGKFGKEQAGRWMDAHSWVVAQFLQHDSRDHDPHLHVHQAVLNRQLCADGVWRALDTTAIKRWRAAAEAVSDRTAEAYAAQKAGIRFETRPDGVAREVVGVEVELRDQMSKRRADITPKTEELAEMFRARFGREPSLHDWSRLAQDATLATRKPKEYASESDTARMDRWEAETREATSAGLAATAVAVLAAGAVERPVPTFVPTDVQLRAIAALEQTARPIWREADVTRALNRALPGELRIAPEAVPVLLDGLTRDTIRTIVAAGGAEPTEAAPDELLLDDGRSVYEAPAARTFTSEKLVVGARLLRAAAVARGAVAMPVEDALGWVARFAESGAALGRDQARALVGVLTSGAMLESITATAGSGKSFLLGALSSVLEQSGRQMFGVATTQAATEVMREEGLTALNITQWLAVQQRLADGSPWAGDQQYALTPGAIIAVDEASMTTQGNLVAVQQWCAGAGVKMLPVGDQAQLGPVGPGGSLADVAAHGINYELTEVFRFREDWEKHASLGLRDGKREAVAEYAKHGRLVDGGSLEQTRDKLARAWLADTLDGKEALLTVPTNAEATTMSVKLRAELVALGRVEADGVHLGMQDATAGVGDLVQARRNGWVLLGWEGNTAAPINRKTYEVVAVRADGGLTVAPVVSRSADGTVLGEVLQLPARYVDRHLTLAYASTPHAAEGRTVDTGLTMWGSGISAPGGLVGMTRGTERNIGIAVTKAAPAAEAAPGEVAEIKERTAAAVVLDVLENHEAEVSALAHMEQAQRDAASTVTHGGRLIDGVAQITQNRTGAALDRLTAAGELTPGDRVRMAGDEAMWSVHSLLRQAELAGHDPDAVLAGAVRRGDFVTAASAARVLHSRIYQAVRDDLTPKIRTFADLIPADTPESWREWLERRAADADERRQVLGEEIAEARPQWAVEALGPVPDDPIARLEWEDNAGIAGVVRELMGHDDPADALGDPPPAQLAEKHALWRAGHAALGLPSAGPEEREASEGWLRCQVVAAQREENWMSPYVGDELAAVSLAHDRARETATVAAAQADAATSDPQRAAMVRGEAQAAADALAVLSEQRAHLEEMDLHRAQALAHTAVTRERGDAARDELAARGVDLVATDERTTAQEWVDAHLAERVEDERVREVRDEAELLDPVKVADQAVLDAEQVPAGQVAESGLAETAIPDIRGTSEPDPVEHTDSELRRRVPPMAQTQAKLHRAQGAVAEITARRDLDAAADTDETAPAAAWPPGPSTSADTVDDARVDA